MKALFYSFFFILCTVPFSDSQIVDMNHLPQGTIRIVQSQSSFFTAPIVKNIGDFNGDGIPDFTLSFPLNDLVYVVYGKRNLAPELNLDSLGPNGFTIYGNPGTNFGTSILSPGDMDRDGKAELAIGAPLDGMGGRVYILKGSYNFQDLLVSETNRFLLIVEGTPSENLGQQLGQGGLVNGDASADLLIPSPSFVQTDENDQTILGAAYIIYGQFSYPERIVQTDTLDPETTLTIFNIPWGENKIFGFGSHWEAVGAFRGENTTDLALVTEIGSITPQVKIRIFPGTSSLKGVTNIDQIQEKALNVTLRLFGTSAMHQIGNLTASDLNGDGKPELIAAFPNASLTDTALGGGVVAVIQNPGQVDGELLISPSDLSSAALLTRNRKSAALGTAVLNTNAGLFLSTLPSTTQEAGSSEGGILYSVPHALLNFAGIREIGEIAPLRFHARDTSDLFATSIAILGDLNRDGIEDLLIGSSELAENPAVAYIIPAIPAVTSIPDFVLY